MASVGGTPTRLLLQPSRFGMLEAQRRLTAAQTEATTGRLNDPGLTLGNRTAAVVNLRLQISSTEASSTRMSQEAAGADTVQNAMSTLGRLAESFRASTAGARTAQNGRSLAAAAADSAIGAMHDALSVTFDGRYLFSGISTGTPPLNSYNEGPRQAAVNAFSATFGFPPSDPAASALTVDEVRDFIEGPLGDLFSDPEWGSIWSSASDEVQRFRLPSGGGLDLSVSVNAPFARKLAQATTIMELLGKSRINASAFAVATDKSLTLVSDAQLSIGDEQARIGIAQARLLEAQTSQGQRRMAMNAALSALESVDPYEAATRVNLLMTQLESSYALTGRISRMNLLSYL